ncbi:hypothetical protein D0438_15900 [Bacillus altitudinis]|nr:hypothetical protein D0438_15900 [Bacillus altitudinis]
MLVLPRLQRFSITLKRRQRAKIKFILALSQQSAIPFTNLSRLNKNACGKIGKDMRKGSYLICGSSSSVLSSLLKVLF